MCFKKIETLTPGFGSNSLYNFGKYDSDLIDDFRWTENYLSPLWHPNINAPLKSNKNKIKDK